MPKVFFVFIVVVGGYVVIVAGIIIADVFNCHVISVVVDIQSAQKLIRLQACSYYRRVNHKQINTAGAIDNRHPLSLLFARNVAYFYKGLHHEHEPLFYMWVK